MEWLGIFIPIVAIIILLVFYKKKIVFWELILLIAPSALIILIMSFSFIKSKEQDTEYLGSYITKVTYYEDWNEKVSCRHPIYCTRTYPCGTSKSPRTCTSSYICGYHHPFDVDYHPEYWSKSSNTGASYNISHFEYERLKRRFNNKEYFVELNRNYHTNDGDAYSTDWKIGDIMNSENLTTESSYENKVRVSHSIFKFENINDKTKKLWRLYDYPKVINNYQPVVLGKSIPFILDRKIQHINSWYGSHNQFRMYILFFYNQSMEAAFKQRSYWEGGNKNEFVVCVGSDNNDNLQWVKAFSWMDKPDLEVRVEDWFNDNKKINLSKFSNWIPSQIPQHWKRKNFKDFDYLSVEITEDELYIILTILFIYNILISIWVVKNEFY